jgi:hypothetical protein
MARFNNCSILSKNSATCLEVNYAPAQCKQLIINLLLAALLAHPQGSTFVKQQAGQGSRALVLELPGRSFS